eukprot:IDg21835t1
MAEYANKSRLPHNFAVNDKVWLSTANLKLEDWSYTRKLHPKFCGPFRVSEKISEVAFRLELSYRCKLAEFMMYFMSVSSDHMFPDPFFRDPLPEPAIHLADGHQEYEVEEILGHRTIRGKSMYLIKWKGYGHHENSWEPEENLSNSQDLLQDYK